MAVLITRCPGEETLPVQVASTTHPPTPASCCAWASTNSFKQPRNDIQKLSQTAPHGHPTTPSSCPSWATNNSPKLPRVGIPTFSSCPPSTTLHSLKLPHMGVPDSFQLPRMVIEQLLPTALHGHPLTPSSCPTWASNNP